MSDVGLETKPMPSAFSTELREQRENATCQLESAMLAGDGFLAEVLMARIEELDEIAAHHGADI
ncbi:MAG TPA: hypothetical protein VHE57_13260 [Mycobacteriales bacterium]|nr:hypothetical protein [Mycobacteriales bacterium]